MSVTDDILARIDATLGESEARWFDFLRIPSVSAQPLHQGDCAAAAAWCCGELAGIGFTAEVLPTLGHPCVLAHHPGTGSGPHLLYYGHYDVQPPEPLELWHSPPFTQCVSRGQRGRKWLRAELSMIKARS